MLRLLSLCLLLAAPGSPFTFTPRTFMPSPATSSSLFAADDFDLDSIPSDASSKMSKSILSLQDSLQTIRTGRASPKMLDKVMVDYYQTATPLRDLATIGAPNAQQLSIDVFDKSCLGDVERAIIDANLGLSPQNDGKVIRVNIPALTEERRIELAKDAKKMGEDAKVGVRNVRRASVDKIKKAVKDKLCGEDEGKRAEASVDKFMEKNVKEVESIVKTKETDLKKV